MDDRQCSFWHRGVVSEPAAALRVVEGVGEAALQYANAPSAEYRIVVRARIMRDAMAGVSNEENARRNGVQPDTVRKWRLRGQQAQSVAEAFADAPRSGRPERISAETRANLIGIACSRPTPELAKERCKARTKEARAEKKAAARAFKRAKYKAQQAERRARQHHERDERRRARHQRLQVTRALKRAEKKLVAANAKLSAAETDAAVAAKGNPASFSAIWTHKTLKAELKRLTGETMSLSEIGRTLNCGGLRPHRVRIWLHSPDPEFEAKTKAICELYVNPPPGAVVLCVDEKPGMQAREGRYVIHAAHDGTTRVEFEYVRHGTGTLIAAFNVKTGEVFGQCRRRTASGFMRFLEMLAKKYPKGDVYIILDNLNVHKGSAIEAFSVRHGGRFHFVYTPLHASWVNQVEIWFGILQRRLLRHGSFTSRAELKAAVIAFIRNWNEVERRPFRWRFRGDFESRVSWRTEPKSCRSKSSTRSRRHLSKGCSKSAN